MMRAMARRIPVRIPGHAVRTVMRSVAFHRSIPSARAASRTVVGTVRSMSSVVRTTTGMKIMESAAAPAQAENRFIGRTRRM